jgi:hypothetical protein
MANKQISINSEAAYSVMTYVANSCSILQSDVKGKLATAFEPLTSLGFLTGALSKIEGQVDTLIQAHNSIVSEISSHLQTVESQEDGLDSGYQSRSYSGGYSGYSGGGGGGSSSDGGEAAGETAVTESSEFALIQEDDGLKISSDELIEILDSIEDDYQDELISLINANKPSDVSLLELFLDNTKSEQLYKTLKKIFGDKFDIGDMKLEDYEKVQKNLLNRIVKSEVSIPELSDKTILAGKSYFAKVCKDNNIDASDLFYNDKYAKTLKVSIQNIYDGNINDTMTEDELENFREVVDSIASKNNMTPDELLENHIDLLMV